MEKSYPIDENIPTFSLTSEVKFFLFIDERVGLSLLWLAKIVCLTFSQPVMAGTVVGNDQQWKLTEEQWDLVKQGEQVLDLAVLKQPLDAWSSQSNVAVELRYPGGEEGELWVEELKDWLISLAIPSKYLFAVAGSGEADVIIIKIVRVGDI